MEINDTTRLLSNAEPNAQFNPARQGENTTYASGFGTVDSGQYYQILLAEKDREI